MIRFIDLTNQIEEDFKCFAFYDTVSSTFISFDLEEVFNSKKDFLDSHEYNAYLTDRCVALIPDHF